ncbi:hypothetical protein LTS08_001941 [Lithohypha guttulata]|nr:hypothetical protein LTS08_001941 [Lithohypha guttulata]
MLRFLVLVVASLCICSYALPVESLKRQTPSAVPQYVLDYAPLVWLDPEEQFFPSDIANQLLNTHPQSSSSSDDVGAAPNPLNLGNLDQLNRLGGDNVYLTANDDWTQTPEWTRGVRPDGSGKTSGAVTCAMLTHNKDNTTLDAFYFYFFAYNQGNTVLGQELGDHLGDWEHVMVRFDISTGTPQAVWLAQHSAGNAFEYAALEKQGDRAVVYSARGSHATYATSGSHDHTIPGLPLKFGFLQDYTGQGTLWDPVQSAYFYSVSFPEGTAPGDASNPSFTAYDDSPTNWLYFLGHWGNAQLSDDDTRQQDFFGQKKYTGGPTGPRDKQINRDSVCGEFLPVCVVNILLPPGSK